MIAKMQQVNVGIIGLGNVGSGTLEVLAENADQIALKLGFRLRVAAVCSRSVNQKKIPEALGEVFKTYDWRGCGTIFVDHISPTPVSALVASFVRRGAEDWSQVPVALVRFVDCRFDDRRSM